MAVGSVQTTSTVNNSSVGSQGLLTTFTSTSGNLLLAAMSVFNSTSSPPIVFTSTLTWAEVLTGSNGIRDYALWRSTSTGGTMTLIGEYTADATGGMNVMVVTEISGHNGLGVVYSTTTASGNSQALVGSIVPTSDNSAIYAFMYARGNATDTRFTASGFAFATARAASAAGNAVVLHVWVNLDIGPAATVTGTWGSGGAGTFLGDRMMFWVEVKQNVVAGTFNYNLLEHRVMRGAGRGLMRGVA